MLTPSYLNPLLTLYRFQEIGKITWVEEVRELLKRPSVSFGDLQAGLCEGAHFPDTHQVEDLRDRLEEKLMAGQRWEEKAQGLLSSRLAVRRWI